MVGARVYSASLVDRAFQKFFFSMGGAISRHPFIFILIPLIIVGGVGYGVTKLSFLSKPEDLWVAPGSQVVKDKDYFEDKFGAFFRVNNFILHQDGGEGNIITAEAMWDLYYLEQQLYNINVSHAGRIWRYHKDFCYKPLHDDTCAIETPLVWFKDMSPSSYDTPTLAQRAYICAESDLAQQCYLEDGITQFYKECLGGWSFGTSTVSAEAAIVTYLINNNEDDHTYTKAAMLWEKEFLRLMKGFNDRRGVRRSDTVVDYMAERSVQDELDREKDSDILIIVISYGIMFLYVSVSLGKIHPVRNKIVIALAGIIIVALSILFSVGLLSFCGVKASLIISEVIPFLILAIGVDNLFILSNKFDRLLESDTPLDSCLSLTLQAVGSSITLSSVCEFVAFMLGSFTEMPAVRSLCLFAGVAVIADFLLQMTIFASIMYIYEVGRGKCVRFTSGMAVFMYIVTVLSWVISSVVWVVRKYILLPLLRRFRMEQQGFNDVFDEDDTTPSTHTQPRSEQSSFFLPFPNGVVRPVFTKVYAPLLMKTPSKIFVLIGTLTLLCVSLYGFQSLEMGLDQNSALPSDSYLIDYFDSEKKYMAVGPPVYVVIKHPDLQYPGNQVAMGDLLEEYSSLKYVDSMNSWIPSFRAWYNDNVNVLDVGKPIPPDNITGHVAEFLKSPCVEQGGTVHGPCGQYHQDDIAFNEDRTVIVATRMMGRTVPLNSQKIFINSYKEAYAESDQFSELDTFPYSLYYIYFSQYSYIVSVAAMNVSLATAAVFIVCWILLGDMYSSILTVLVVLIINLDLWGIMGYWDIYVNAVSVVNVVMCIGISVEFCVHIVRAFLIAPGSGRQRATYALCEIGASVFSGITLTKFAGVIPLAFAKSQIFVIYYFRMFLCMVLLGMWHGLVFLPVFLSVVGPGTKSAPRSKLGNYGRIDEDVKND